MLIKIRHNKYKLGLKNYEFQLFLNKFYGSLISRGRKSFSFRQFDIILINFKKQLKKDPFVQFRKAIDNLIPLLLTTQKKIGRVYQTVPKLALGNRKFVVMLNWIIKKQKGKSNILGFKIDEISRHLIDAVDKKGLLINLKKMHLAVSLAGKHFLYYGRRKSLRRKRKVKNVKNKKKKIRKFTFNIFELKKFKYTRKRWYFLRRKRLLHRYNRVVK